MALKLGKMSPSLALSTGFTMDFTLGIGGTRTTQEAPSMKAGVWSFAMSMINLHGYPLADTGSVWIGVFAPGTFDFLAGILTFPCGPDVSGPYTPVFVPYGSAWGAYDCSAEVPAEYDAGGAPCGYPLEPCTIGWLPIFGMQRYGTDFIMDARLTATWLHA